MTENKTTIKREPLIKICTDYDMTSLIKFKLKEEKRYNKLFDFVDFCKDYVNKVGHIHNYMYTISISLPYESNIEDGSKEYDYENYKDYNYEDYASVIFARYEHNDIFILEKKVF